MPRWPRPEAMLTVRCKNQRTFLVFYISDLVFDIKAMLGNIVEVRYYLDMR